MSALCRLSNRTELRIDMPDVACWLTASEQARFATFGTASRRDSFIAGRWLARLTVQGWAGSRGLPSLEIAASGACRVAGHDGVFVSISHSGDDVACVVADRPMGMDVERTHRHRDYAALANVVHSAAQRRRIETLEPESRERAFLEIWTLKEAWLKSREMGLDFELMSTLEFDDAAIGDTAVATIDGLVIAVAANQELPKEIQLRSSVTWRRYRTRQSNGK